MTKVRILPEILSNQIAAGEVVERPSSVVKELVENSIDAGATLITIEIVKGGKSLIRVSDNGIGLQRDDALLSIERYATSKIFTKEDLFSISTMGFRGEALPSIASVSKFTMVTRPRQSQAGVKIEINGGRLFNVEDAGAPVGTMIEVKNLFFNTPARKKFLKTDTTEAGHISDLVSSIALGHPAIRFRLISNGKIQKDFSDLNNPYQRAFSVLGKQTGAHLCEIDFSDALCRISGYAVHPLVTRSTANKIYFFVNNRLVSDRGLISALFQGYRGRIMKGRYPLAAVFIQLDYDQVDINVHPSKKTVKFYQQGKVYHAVSTAISQGLSSASKNTGAYSQSRFSTDRPRPQVDIESEKEIVFEQKRQIQTPKVEQSQIQWHYKSRVEEKKVVKPAEVSDSENKVAAKTMADEFISEPIAKGGDSKNRKILGQVLDTYIVVDTKEGMMLIDQHAAHERIMYEALKKSHLKRGIVSQDLIVPETIELTGKEAAVLEIILEELDAVGFKIEPFGGTTFVIKSVPDPLSGQAVQSLLTDIIEAAVIDKNAFAKDVWLDECLMLMACHHAIRARQRLNDSEMEKLLDDLETCENPMHCPHGRPVMVTVGKKELEKLFRRIQ